MKISSRDWNINKILKGGYYKIPRFQRPYSWEKAHVQEFWSDVMLEENKEYFIGAMVVYKQGMDGYGIVDGQQRLTTIIMVLCALRNFYEHELFSNSSRGIQALIEKKNLSDESTYVLQTETSYPYFEEYILKSGNPDTQPNDTVEEARLIQAFDQITALIKLEISKIKKSTVKIDKASEKILAYLDLIRDRILELNVIFIELENVDDAQTAYETLNTRGKDLEASDLIKTYLMRVVKAMNSKVDIAKHNWSKINENIDSTIGIVSAGEIGINSFLLHFWMSKYSYSSEKDLFSKVKEKIGPTIAKSFLKDLVDNSVWYKSIINPELGGWKKDEATIKKSLLAIQGLRVVQQLPMVLSVVRRYKEGKIKNGQVRDLLEAIEHFHYIFNSITTQRSSGGISTMYSSYARQLSGDLDSNALGNLIKEFRKNLFDKLPSFEEFKVSFRSLEYKSNFTKSRNIIRYTLSKIDEFKNKGGAKVDYKSSNIEHILSQSPKVKSAKHEEYVGRLGNLILINPEVNGRLANKDFIDKKVILLKCGMYIDDVIKISTGWSEKEIDDRTDWLADVAYHQVFKVR